jgi:IS30 family transposase
MKHYKHYKQLTTQERDQLAIWKAAGVANKECARRLGRDPSTIGRELKRNDWQKDDIHYYVAIHAQALAKVRAIKVAHSKHPLKNAQIYDYVTKQLRQGFSPDQIAGRLQLDHADDNRWWITAETIYRWIYQPEQQEDRWYEYLRRKQKKRKKKQGRGVHRSQIPDRVSIHERPEAVNNRTVFGHWEGDTVEGRRHTDGLHTEVERMSRKLLALKVPAITSVAAVAAQKTLFGQLPSHARQSTTLDNGKENHLHFELKEIDMATYFADPYSSFQRGTNEHGNWHLRYYFPKGTDFTTISDDELQDVVWEINNRPRKILGYKTAEEVYTELLARGCTSK